MTEMLELLKVLIKRGVHMNKLENFKNILNRLTASVIISQRHKYYKVQYKCYLVHEKVQQSAKMTVLFHVLKVY